MNRVILAEKPSQAKSYAEALDKYNNKQGYIETEDSTLGNYIITYGFGHLIELQKPGDYKEEWKHWDFSNFPIIPDNFQYTVSSDKRKQFNIVKKLLSTADEIIIATDIDREGEAIARLIIQLSGCSNKVIKRLWINSLEKEAIRQGLTKLKEGHDTYNLFVEAQTRAMADWLVGMNLSPLYTLQARQVSNSNKIKFSIGRVQTPTLYMIYNRQKQIENFKPEKYYELEANISNVNSEFTGKLVPNQKFKSIQEIQEFTRHINLDNKQGTITKIEKETKNANSPKLFSLSTLQSEINKKYKASASDTLQAVQILYENKLLTYPRTDCNFITDQEFNYLKEVVEDYINLLNLPKDYLNYEPSKIYVNNKKVQEHHAIIPTKTIPNKEKLDNLTELQKNIYTLIVKTTLAMFYPKYQYEETNITTNYQGLAFLSKGTININDGWTRILPNNKKGETTFDNVQEGNIVSVELNNLEKETTPPSLFTEGTLIKAMKNAGNLVENNDDSNILKQVEGIGTEATRAGIIENLKKQNYIQIIKNKIYMTDLGNLLCSYISNVNILKNAEMTAKWEKFLAKIGKSTNQQEAYKLQKLFIEKLKLFINNEIENSNQYNQNIEFKNQLNTYLNNLTDNSLGTCHCGGDIIDHGKFFGCSNHQNCDIKSIPKSFAGHKFTKKEVQQLFTNKSIENITFKSKKGKSYKADLVFTDKLKIEFKNSKSEQ